MLDDNDNQCARAELDPKLQQLLNRVLSEIGRHADEQMARWDSIAARLTRQAGLIQNSMGAIARLTEFVENTGARWIDLDKRVRAIEDRLKGAA